MEKKGKKVTIGLLVSGIMDKFTESICKGVMHGAKKADVNLVIFPCKYLDRDLSQNKELMYEYQYNTLFSYVTKENLDAILVSAGSIGCYTSEERMCEVLEAYLGIPCILIASKLDGYVSVMYDNDAGIREALEYLIHDLNCRKFGMIGGPDVNTDAYERKQVFLDVLKKHDIPFDEKNFVKGNLSRNNSDAFCKMLDSNPDVEAIFCVNDDSAIGLYDEMKKRGIIPGKDVYVFGYDNTVSASRSKPALSSVWADSVALGERGVEMIMHMLSGEDVSSQTLSTKFIHRESFGNKESSSDRDKASVLDYHNISTYFDEIFYRYMHEESQEMIAVIYELFCNMIEKLIEFLEKPVFDMKLYTDVLELLDDFLNHSALEYADMDKLMKYIELIYQNIKLQEGRAERAEADEVFRIILRKIIGAMDYRFRMMRDVQEAEAYSMKLFVGNIMQFEKGNDQSYAMLLQNLDWLNIQNAYVYIYDKPITHLYRENFQLPKYLYLKAVRRNGIVESIPVTKQRIRSANIYRHEKMESIRYSMVLLPLFSNEVLYGAVLCDLTEKLFDNGEFVVNQMSSAVKMIELLKSNEKIQQQLEENLVTLRQKNIVLDNLSKSDGLTGILNRRGFEDAAESFLEQRRWADKKVLVAYIDMNNLKIINDRYGHEEGDFSLKLIGEKIADFIRTNGICGRIGGDEFACIMECESENEELLIQQQLYEAFQNYNMQSDKPYNITVSVGAYILDEDDNTTLKEALALADEKLYVEKQHRIKHVEKAQTL